MHIGNPLLINAWLCNGHRPCDSMFIMQGIMTWADRYVVIITSPSPQAVDQRVVTVALGNNRSAMRIVESVKVLHRLQGQELILFLAVSVSVSV